MDEGITSQVAARSAGRWSRQTLLYSLLGLAIVAGCNRDAADTGKLSVTGTANPTASPQAPADPSDTTAHEGQHAAATNHLLGYWRSPADPDDADTPTSVPTEWGPMDFVLKFQPDGQGVYQIYLLQGAAIGLKPRELLAENPFTYDAHAMTLTMETVIPEGVIPLEDGKQTYSLQLADDRLTIMPADGQPQTFVRVSASHFELPVPDLEPLKQANAEFEYLPGTEEILTVTLANCDVTEELIAALQTIPTLQNVDLQHSSLSDAVLSKINRCRALHVLVLDGTPIGDVGLTALASLPNLFYLSLKETKITDLGLSVLRNYPDLQVLNIGETGVSDRGIEALLACPQLRTLDISGTQVGDDGLAQLAQHIQLQELNVQRTRVTREGLDRFHMLRKQHREEYIKRFLSVEIRIEHDQ
jgi:hypothetical protein